MEKTDLKLECEKIWSDTLGLNKQLPDEDFFDLGGTSLTLIKLLGETKKVFSVDLDINQLADGLTLNIFRELVEQKNK